MASNGASPSTSFSPQESPLPTTGYTDFSLLSAPPAATSGWHHNIIKFHAGDVDPTEWAKPVKLNRKDPRAVRRMTEEERERITLARQRAAAQRAGIAADELDLKPKKEEDEDKKPVKKEREEMDLSLVGTAGSSGLVAKPKAAPGRGGMFKKKTKRVFVGSVEARRLQRQEWAPWVLEDDERQHRWIGRLEGGGGELEQTKSEANKGTENRGWRPAAGPSEAGGGGSAYVAFVRDEALGVFRVVPIHRWYKFTRGPQYATLGTEEAEDEYNRQQKAKDDSRWMMKQRLTASLPKPSSSTSGSLVPSAASKPRQTGVPSLPPGGIRSRLLGKSASLLRREPASASGRKLKIVNRGSAGGEGGDDELGGGGRGRSGRRAVDQEEGEFDYEEDFADDEEGIAVIDDLADEQELKELQERVNRQMRGAAGIDGAAPEEEDDESEELTNTGKEIKKLVKKIDKNGLYESDDEDSGSEDDDDAKSVGSDANGPLSRSGSATPQLPNSSHPSKHHRSRSSHSKHPSASTSRAVSRSGSPVPSGSGAAVVAKRATSPDAGRRSNSTSRAGSLGPSGKRKRAEGDEAEAKRRKNATPPPAHDDANLLTAAMVVALLKSRPTRFKTAEVLHHFRKALKIEPRNRELIGDLLQSVSNLVDHELVLKQEWAG